MLVLTRKLNQSLHIGENIQLTILEVQNGSVKIGIEAPRNIRIMRQEIIDQVTELNINSSLNAKNINLTELAKKLSK
ncbi:carbon storage regulator CsrA [Clostridium sp. 'deep sea']|jgi:carbon storage regulator|uniref:carbon storage regulator CsrA n=1 Tax=Clostridium sp. 'deep sea' TaxID=2779445 RepID=UPI00189691F8|nr:carbon storage regulator CsrA [Clostridium sp. 'deep sea']QOR35366.1 carbon storage regulator CsrA [Clostridium sp. 'deep sea']